MKSTADEAREIINAHLEFPLVKRMGIMVGDNKLCLMSLIIQILFAGFAGIIEVIIDAKSDIWAELKSIREDINDR